MAENWNKSFSYIEYHATPILTVVSVAPLIPFRYDLNEIRAYSTPKSGTEPIPGMQPSTFEIGSVQRSFAPLQNSRWNHRSYVRTEALSGQRYMTFVAAQKSSAVYCQVWT